MENYSGSDMAWYRGGSVAAAVVIKVVLWSELVSLALGSGLCQVFGGIEGALIHKGGHRQFLPCMGVAFYPDSIGVWEKKTLPHPQPPKPPYINKSTGFGIIRVIRVPLQ